ncbi:MAG: GNAT family N-acetyltransferase [candidate division NC10 bacterium]|nr:GNAT family N-acetyltransferase [candidate division NC10 bacterium]
MTGSAQASPSADGQSADRSIAVREFRWEDLPQVRAVWDTAGPGIHLDSSDEAEGLRRKWEHDPDLFLVAQADTQIIGVVLAGFDGRRAIVYHLAVLEAWRRRGIGRRLMIELESRLRARGCPKSYLIATPDNQVALAFYRDLGWEVMDMVLMGKRFT